MALAGLELRVHVSASRVLGLKAGTDHRVQETTLSLLVLQVYFLFIM